VPRAGLTSDDVIAAAAALADEIGFQGVTMGLLADRLGVRPPSLYKHVSSLADVRHGVATLAAAELSEVIRDAVQGKSGSDALAALMAASRGYIKTHPGRYMAGSNRVIASMAAVLRGYGIGEDEMDHALRMLRSTMHGFAILEVSGGFQWDADPDQSYKWLIGFVDRGLRSG
jgi:AcrR family transcriptional regulator